MAAIALSLPINEGMAFIAIGGILKSATCTFRKRVKAATVSANPTERRARGRLVWHRSAPLGPMPPKAPATVGQVGS